MMVFSFLAVLNIACNSFVSVSDKVPRGDKYLAGEAPHFYKCI